MITRLILLLLLWAGTANAADLYPGDGTKDSGPAIVEHALAVKQLPAGVFFYKPPLDFGVGEGGAVFGVGAGSQARKDGAWRNQPVTVLIPIGNYEGSKIVVRRSNFDIKDVQLPGCVVTDHINSRGKGAIIEVTQQGAAWPVGDCEIDATLTNSEVGVYAAPGNHADHLDVRGITHSVDTPILLNESQSVGHHFDLLCKGSGKTIINVKSGGRLTGRIKTNGTWERWLTVGDATNKTFPTKNNGYYKLHVLMDGGDSVGSPLEEKYKYEWSRPYIEVTGFAADDAKINGDPILLNKARVRIKIERCLKPPYIFEAN